MTNQPHQLAFTTLSLAARLFRNGDKQRYLIAGKALDDSDFAWGEGPVSQTAADLFEEIVTELLGTNEDFTIDDAAAIALERMAGAHEVEMGK